ncbi:unnamed protein product [Staurois parvus]|uniref:Uncharacterized protein n=1 Tax=Staurois parvus TaxID=386267 RepID=A0ABN9BUQ7_9NEOB|nr:unnamed protein product [Staurois parvus]
MLHLPVLCNSHGPPFLGSPAQGRTDNFDHLGTARGPGVSRGPHEMPLGPFSSAFLSLGKDTGVP